MATIGVVTRQITEAVRDLKAAGLQATETNVSWWINAPASERAVFLPVPEG